MEDMIAQALVTLGATVPAPAVALSVYYLNRRRNGHKAQTEKDKQLTEIATQVTSINEKIDNLPCAAHDGRIRETEGDVEFIKGQLSK